MRITALGVGLLASAFSPLLVALVLVAQPLPGVWWNIALAVAAALPMLLLVAVIAAARSIPAERLDVRTATPRDVDVLSFMGSYLVPIAIALFAPDSLRLAAMVLLLLLLVLVYLNAELYYLNPLLAAAGFRVFQVVDESGTSVSLLTRRRAVPNASHLDARLIAPSIYLELGSSRE
jgi:hypothetical protein